MLKWDKNMNKFAQKYVHTGDRSKDSAQIRWQFQIEWTLHRVSYCTHRMWLCRGVCQWYLEQWGQDSWPGWPPSGPEQPAGQEASYWPLQGAPPLQGWFDVPPASGCWDPAEELGIERDMGKWIFRRHNEWGSKPAQHWEQHEWHVTRIRVI